MRGSHRRRHDLIMSQIESLRLHFQELYVDLIHDPLTGLYLRHELPHVISQEMERAKRYKRPFTIVFLDIVKFKKLNNERGHPYGDQILKRVAGAIKRFCRKLDTPFRWAGDEFLVVLSDTDNEGGLRFCRRIEKALPDIPFHMGISTWRKDITYTELFKKADRQVIVSKASKNS